LSFRRWVSVASVGVVAAAVVLPFVGVLRRLAGLMSDAASGVEPWALGLAVGVVVAAVMHAWGSGRWLALLGVRHFVGYPPLWMGLIVAVVVLAMVDPPTRSGLRAIVDPRVLPLVGLGVAAPAFVVLVAFAQWWRRRRGSKRNVSERSEPTAAATLDQLPDDWYKDDTPVRFPEDDRFGHRDIAQRIADRLRDEASPSTALIGPKGSGKTTIKEFVKELLRRRAKDDVEARRLEIVDVSLWPFDTPEAAVRGVLRECFSTLGKHASMLAINGLPTRYVDVIERAGGRYGALMRLLASSKQPDEIIAEIDRLAGMCGLRLVVWIEDLERFFGSDRETVSRESRDASDERARAVQAMLYLLDQQKNIAVVVADASLRSRIDPDKIVRYIERPPRIGPRDALEEIILARGRLLSGVIDPADPEARRFLQPGSGVVYAMTQMTLDGEPTPKAALATIIETPRALKLVLRTVEDVWSVAPGEVDIDHLIMVTALRVCRPDAFAFIDSNVAALRSGRSPSLEREASPSYAERAIESFEKLHPDVALRVLVRCLFPETKPGYGLSFRVPQGVYRDSWSSRDYWRRATSPVRVPDRESDQRLLTTIVAFKDGSDDAGRLLAERLVEEGTRHGFNLFTHLIAPGRIADLLELVADGIVQTSPREVERDERVAALHVVLWALKERPPRSSTTFRSLGRVVHSLGVHDIQAVYDLVRIVAGSLLQQDDVAALVRLARRKAFRKIRREGFGWLVEAGGDGSYFALCWLMRMTGRNAVIDEASEEEWRALGEVIATHDSPIKHRVAAALACVTSSDSQTRLDETDDEGVVHRHDTVWKVEKADFDRMFGETDWRAGLPEVEQDALPQVLHGPHAAYVAWQAQRAQ